MLGLLLLAFSLASCSNDDDDDNNLGTTKAESMTSIIGYWEEYSYSGWEKEDGVKVDEWDELSDEGYGFRFYFFEDGTGQDKEYASNTWGTSNFTWALSGNKVLISFGEDESFKERTYTIKSLTSTTLVLEFSNKQTLKSTNGYVEWEIYEKQTFHRIGY
jgi:hypothetical protein